MAAFFSEARGEALVDVHVTRRKHVKPAKGGPGRVFVAHSDTLRVAPRDPEGRLRSGRRPAAAHAGEVVGKRRGPTGAGEGPEEGSQLRLSSSSGAPAPRPPGGEYHRRCRGSWIFWRASWPPRSAVAIRLSRRGRRARRSASCSSGRWPRGGGRGRSGPGSSSSSSGRSRPRGWRERVGLKDPGIVVVDEVLGQWVTLPALPFTPGHRGPRLPALPGDGHREAVAGAGPRAPPRRLGDHGRRRRGRRLRAPGAAGGPPRLAGRPAP